jgi:tight adherence protein C
MILVLLLAALLAGLAVALIVRAIAAGRVRNQALLAQVGSYGFAAQPGATEQAPPRLEALFSKLATWVGEHFEDRLDERRRERIRARLNAAGLYRLTVARYIGYRIVWGVGLPLGLLLLFGFAGRLSSTAVVLVLVFAALGLMGPAFWLDQRIGSRTTKIDYEIPELVDLLVTTVEAGVGFLSALQLASRRVGEPLGQELRVMLREQAMGLTLDEALENLGSRSKSSNLLMFVQAVIQGETLGVSIGKILRDLAVDMRKRRRQMAEERAQKAPIKLLFPLIIFILPAMFVILLGPALYDTAKQLGG